MVRFDELKSGMDWSAMYTEAVVNKIVSSLPVVSSPVGLPIHCVVVTTVGTIFFRNRSPNVPDTSSVCYLQNHIGQETNNQGDNK